MNHVWSDEADSILTEYSNSPGFQLVTRGPQEDFVHDFVRSQVSDIPRFDFRLFYSEQTRSLKGLVYFGSHIQGFPGQVHGGAIATILDTVFGVLLWQLKMNIATANLSVDYKKFIKIQTEVIIECHVEKVENRKIYVSGKLKSLDGSVIHDESTGFFLRLGSL